MKGWISLHRSIENHWIWTGSDEKFDRRSAWVDLLLMANHKDRRFLLGNELVTVKRGSFISSIRKLCQKWGWSNSKVRGFLATLERDRMIAVKSDAKKTTLTICNYDDYQVPSDGEKIGETTRKRRESDGEKSEKHTNNNDNNVNNVNNDNNTTGGGPHKKIIEKWNGLNVKNIVSINSGTKREIMLKARLKEYGENKILEAIDRVGESDFLQGKTKEAFVITFDWFVRPNNFPKVLEGNYSRNRSKGSGSTESRDKFKTKFHLSDSRSSKYSAEELEAMILKKQRGGSEK